MAKGVRVARTGDAQALSELILAFRDHLGAVRPTAEELSASLPVILSDASTELCLAVSAQGTALGYSHWRIFPSLWASAPEAHLEDLFVLASERGQGIGGALLAFTMERAAAGGAVAMGLHTNEANQPAQAFYRAAGFEPRSETRWDGGREIYWGREIP